jgi:cysteine synthase A
MRIMAQAARDPLSLNSSLIIGNTPLERLAVRIGLREHAVLLKREEYNPFGSIKDRTAVGLLQAIEATEPKKGLTIVESTSGNLGVALAALCRLRGHNFIAVVDPKVPHGSLALMRRFGTRIEMVSTEGEHGNYLTSRINRAKQLCAEISDAWWSNQYANRANPRVHFSQTAPEILRQAERAIDVIFVPISTGGTLRGISDRFRRESLHTRVVAVDVYGSIALGGTPGVRHLTGIGANRPSQFVDGRHYDEKILIEDPVAVAMCRKLRDEADVYLGGSAGAAVGACIRYLIRHPSTGMAVCVCPDGGGEYSETLYNDEWLAERQLDPRPVYRWLDRQQVRFQADRHYW